MRTLDDLRAVALQLAMSNAEADPNLSDVLLFPDEEGNEIRLIELDPTAPSGDQRVEPFYFAADSTLGIPFRSAIALIRPEEVGHLELPEGWGDWSDAVRIWSRGRT